MSEGYPQRAAIDDGDEFEQNTPFEVDVDADVDSEKSSETSEAIGQNDGFSDDDLEQLGSRPLQRRLMTTSQPQTGKQTSEVSWKDLPRKDQLIVITLARLSEPLVQTSLQSYMFYMLKWLSPDSPDSAISSQAGILHASFTAAQFLTAMLWGRLADSSRFGRKTVLMIGLGGTMVSCIGFAFSTTFWQALFFRSLGGITNGNIGVLRTMISEIVREKKYQSRAFLLLPMTFNIGVIIGPILGGLLSDPVGSYPGLFGDVEFLKRFPYAAPNLLSAFFLFCAMMSIWLFLEETLDSRLEKRDWGIEIRRKILAVISKRTTHNSYVPLAIQDSNTITELPPVDSSDGSPRESTAGDLPRPTKHRPRYTQRLPFRRIFTRNVMLTFLSSFILAFHVGTFNSLWFVFLSTPVSSPADSALSRRNPLLFTGGLGLPPRSVGLAMAILGVLGIFLQLTIYPRLSSRLGTLLSWRIFLVFFPVAYFLAPFLSVVSSDDPPPSPKSGILVWLAITVVLGFQVVARTFALPAQTILVNNCSPHPSVLGTVHGVGQSVSSFARTIGPVLGGWLFGLGLDKGVVGAVWWGLSAVAVGGIVGSFFVREGDGHEIWLEDDEE